jgi:hypothetical protein
MTNEYPVLLVGNGAVGKAVANSLKALSINFKQYDSKTVQLAYDYSPQYLIYAGVPGTKWHANDNAIEDRDIVRNAYNNIMRIKPSHIILVSTIDAMFKKGDEGYSLYGENRRYLETLIERGPFDAYSVVRLPALKGSTIHKNIFYDLMYPEQIKLTPALNATLDNIVQDLETHIHKRISTYRQVLITNPYSRMYELDLDNVNLATTLMTTIGTKLLIDSTQPRYVYEIYKDFTGLDMPRFEKSYYTGKLPCYDYSSLNLTSRDVAIMPQKGIAL